MKNLWEFWISRRSRTAAWDQCLVAFAIIGSILVMLPLLALANITISGALALVTIDIGIMISAVLTKRSATEMGIEPGAKVFISFKASAVHVLDQEESPEVTYHDSMAAT